MKIIGAPQGDTLRRISPMSNNSFNFILNSSNSGIDFQYAVLSISSVPCFKLIANSNSLSGRKPGNSSRNTSANSHTTERFSNPSTSPFLFSTNIAYNLNPFPMIFCSGREDMNLKETPWFLPAITLLCPTSSIKPNHFVLQLSV
jgi:hypothetical protein